MESRSGRIRELDGWRGISVLLVVVHHCLSFEFPTIVGSRGVLHHVAWFLGELGVKTFFVISGFVITRLLIEEERQHGSILVKGFYIRRAFRILPAFYVFLLMIAALRILHVLPGRMRDIAGAALFLRDTKLKNYDWFTGHAWSLAVEEQFYLIFPLFWVMSRNRRRGSLLSISLVIFLVWSFLAQLRIFDAFLQVPAISGFLCINVGVLLAVIEPQAKSLASSLPPLLVFLVAVFLFFRPVPNLPVFNGLFTVAAPFCIAVLLIHTASRKGWASFILLKPVVLWLGLVSYSGYLWQELFTGSATMYGSPLAVRVLHSPLFGLLVVALSYYCVERPFTQKGRSISQSFAVSYPDKAGTPLMATAASESNP